MHPHIAEIGYHCRDYFVGQWDRFKDTPLGRPRPLHAPARRGHLRPRRGRAPARHRHPGHRDPRGAGPGDQPRLPGPGAGRPRRAGRTTPARWSCRRPARCSTACGHDVSPTSAGPVRAARRRKPADRSRAQDRPRAHAHGRHRPHPRVLRRPDGLRRRLRGPRRPRLGHHRRHPVRLRRRLSPPSRLQHLEVGRRPAAARRRDRPAPHRPALLDPRPLSPTTVKRLLDGGVKPRAALDHGTHEAVYLLDPDGNTLELAWDRPFDQWVPYGDPDAPAIDAKLDLDDLLAEAS